MAPADEDECRQMLYTGFLQDRPAAVRYPRGRGPGVAIRSQMTALPIAKAEVHRRGRRVAILAFGAMLGPAIEAGERLDATVVNMRFVKPLDRLLIRAMVTSHELLVTIEDNVVAGSAGSAVNECLARMRIPVPVFNMGLPDRFIEHGSRDELLADGGLDADGIVEAVALHDRKRRRHSKIQGLKTGGARTPIRLGTKLRTSRR
jgi:1-deoxy-D-xylulose-5-phosphate synthase